MFCQNLNILFNFCQKLKQMMNFSSIFQIQNVFHEISTFLKTLKTNFCNFSFYKTFCQNVNFLTFLDKNKKSDCFLKLFFKMSSFLHISQKIRALRGHFLQLFFKIPYHREKNHPKHALR